MLNKTRYEMNKRTERPDLVFYQRKLINYIYIPKWFVTRWEKLIIPVGVLSLIFLLWFSLLQIDALWYEVVRNLITLIFLVVAGVLILSLLFFGEVLTRKPIVTTQEYDEMVPQAKKADLLYWQWDSTFYDGKFHVVSQEEYNQILVELS